MHGRKAVVLISENDRARVIFGQGVASGLVELREGPSVQEAIRLAEMRFADLFVVALDDDQAAVEALRELRAYRSEAKAIILGSGRGGAVSVLNALREHAFAFLAWPWSVSEAREAISRALSIEDWEDGIEVLSARPEWVGLRLRCRHLTAARVLDFLSQLQLDMSPEEQQGMGTAIREVLLNAIEHGAGLNPSSWVRVSRIRTARTIIYHVEDPGPGFSPDQVPHAAISNPPGQPLAHVAKRADLGLRPGGIGILVAKGLVDDIVYSEKGNEVILIRHLPQEGP